MVELQGQGGGRDWRFFCGLISAFLANSPSVITAWVLSDLFGIFCMFGFYLIMFYSGSLLCTFCSACLRCCCCCKKKQKQKNTCQMALSILYDFPLILFLSPLSEITRFHHEVMGPMWHWLRSLSRRQTSIFINMSFCVLS